MPKGHFNSHKMSLCLTWKAICGYSDHVIRMDAMEIDDSIYINKSLTMTGLITKGTV